MNWAGYLPRSLPPPLLGLYELAIDLRWSWNHTADALWEFADPQLWHATNNPWLIFQSLTEARIAHLAATHAFVDEVQRLVAARAEYLRAPTWFAERHRGDDLRPIAYFSMEFGLSEALPIYSGGLGILAGDHLKTASDLGVPLIGIGLLYQQGYFRQALDSDGNQRELHPYNEPSMMPVTPVPDGHGGWLRIELRMPGRSLKLRVWQVTVGRVALYLLDSNDPLNTPADRGITGELYGGGPEMRLQQEIVLGLGGWRLVQRIRPDCQVCHLNEGHAAFAILERARSFMASTEQSFEVAMRAIRAGNVFTTHTPVAAGVDRYAPELAKIYVDAYAPRLGITPDALMALGRANPADDREPFNMAYLAIRGAGRVNGVSRLHGEVSRRIFALLFPRWPEHEVPVGHVTNGVHMPTWDSAGADQVWTEACGKERWVRELENIEQRFSAIEDEALWMLRENERERLVRNLRLRLERQAAAAGSDPSIVGACRLKLDPKALTIGFARRFTGYKRPVLLLRHPERLIPLLNDRERPLQIVVAGKAHPRDQAGKEMVRQWIEFTRRPEVANCAVFIEDYDMAIAAELVQGVDLWLNTPLHPWEACGTSGMKVLVNGGLNLSELDGWWAEAWAPGLGWAFGDRRDHDHAPEWDEIEAEQIYSTLEREIIPAFYDRDWVGIPGGWIARMRRSMMTLAPRFSSNRMLRDYTEGYYLPSALEYSHRAANGGLVALELARWAADLDKKWRQLSCSHLQVEQTDGYHRVRLEVMLGEIDPSAVRVQLYAEPLDGAGSEVHPMGFAEGPDQFGRRIYTANIPARRPAGDYTARIVPAHPHAALPLEAPHILWNR